MTKRKHQIHKYEEGEIVYKKWFRADVLLKKFKTFDSDEKRIEFCNSIGLGPSRVIEMSKPDFVIFWTTADRYATKLRLSSLYDMV